jgi:hypothetical protein
MHPLFNKLLKAPWLINQPLTYKPEALDTKVSDLFIWRNDDSFETYFELLDLASLFEDEKNSPRNASLIFFNSSGKELFSKNIELKPLERQTINISTVLKTRSNKKTGNHGTFCVFHSKTPNCITKNNSFLSERGYVSYSFKNSPLRTYVHGNFDAISNENKLSLLGGSSYLNREYNLQFILNDNANNEIALVNPSRKAKILSIKTIDLKKNKILNTWNIRLEPRASHIQKIETEISCRATIKSKLIMARPLVFSHIDNKINVFHG